MSEGGDIVDRGNQRVPKPEISDDEVAVYVGTDVDYGPDVEFGTSRMRAQPYLRPALDQNKSEVRREIAEAYRDQIMAATR